MLRKTLIPVALLVLATGCSTSHDPGTKSVPALIATGATVRVTDHCTMALDNSLSPTAPPTSPAIDHGGAIPADFTPVRVISCTIDVQKVPGDGTWQVAIQREAPPGAVPALVAAYRSATATVQTGDVSCTAVADMDPRIAFIDAHGTALWPAAPRDPVCHHIVPSVITALQAVQWNVTATRKTAHATTAGGCAPAWKDMIAIQPTDPAAPGPFFSRPPTRMTVCVYKTNPTTGSVQETDGTYSRERVLTPGDLARAVTVLDAAPPASACTATATEFAVLLTDASSRETYLELDGCHRVGRIDTGGADDRPGLRQLDAAGVATLAGSGA